MNYLLFRQSQDLLIIEEIKDYKYTIIINCETIIVKYL